MLGGQGILTILTLAGHSKLSCPETLSWEPVVRACVHLTRGPSPPTFFHFSKEHSGGRGGEPSLALVLCLAVDSLNPARDGDKDLSTVTVLLSSA